MKEKISLYCVTKIEVLLILIHSRLRKLLDKINNLVIDLECIIETKEEENVNSHKHK